MAGLAFRGALVPRAWDHRASPFRRGPVMTKERWELVRLGRTGNRLLQIAQFLASSRADFLQQRNVFLGLIELPGLDIEFAQVFERALVLGIEVERLAVECIGLFVIAALAQAESHQ